MDKTRLHSSRMHTARSLTVSPSMHCAGGVCLVWGVPGPEGGCLVQRGVPGPGGCLVLEGVWSGGAWTRHFAGYIKVCTLKLENISLSSPTTSLLHYFTPFV